MIRFAIAVKSGITESRRVKLNCVKNELPFLLKWSPTSEGAQPALPGHIKQSEGLKY